MDEGAGVLAFTELSLEPAFHWVALAVPFWQELAALLPEPLLDSVPWTEPVVAIQLLAHV